MGKALFAGLWVLLVTLAGSYAVTIYKPEAEGAAEAPAVEVLKMKPITVPVVSENGIEGHVFAQLAYVVDKAKHAEMGESIEPVLSDQSLRELYGTESSRYVKPKKSDLDEIAKALVEGANRRLGEGIVKEVLVEEMSFIPKEKSRLGGGRE